MYEKAKLPIFTIERTELNLKAKFALVVALLIISFDNQNEKSEKKLFLSIKLLEHNISKTLS